MRVTIADAVFRSTACFDALDRILDHFISERHRWEIGDVDAIKGSSWLASGDRVSRRNTEILEKCFVAAAHASRRPMHTLQVIVDVTPNPPNRLAPADAVSYLASPAIVIVENEESDGAFLTAIINAYGRTDLWFAFQSRWIELDHAGGYGEIEKRIRRYLERNQGPRRVLVVTDSDRLFPGHQSQTFKKIDEACTTLGVPYIVLAKRAIENYLPVGALQRSGNSDCYQAFLKLTTVQRDHYGMKKGFGRDKSDAPRVLDEQAAIFEHVPRKALENLCGGFGGEAWKLFQTAADVITADTMNLTCTADPRELPELLDRIEAIV